MLPDVRRGRLLGALVIGQKPLGESFAPDELDALGLVARGAGVTLALLGATGEAAPTSIEALLVAIERLPDALAAKLGFEREPAYGLRSPSDGQ